MNVSSLKILPSITAIALCAALFAQPSEGALIGHWDFNNQTLNSGTTGSHNDAVAVNGATYVAGPTGFGSALVVTAGSTSTTVRYALVNNSASGAEPLSLVGTSYTWSIWGKNDVAARVTRIIEKEDGADFSGGYGAAFAGNVYTHSAGPPTNAGNYSTGAALPSDTAWHLYAVRYDMTAGSLDLFVDGTKTTLAASGVAALKSDGDDPLRFGNAAFADFSPPNGNFGYQGFSGAIDDARVYDVALSDSAIAALSQAPEPTSVTLLAIAAASFTFARRRASR